MASKALIISGVLLNALLWSQSRYSSPPSTLVTQPHDGSWHPVRSEMRLSSIVARAWRQAAEGQQTDENLLEQTVSF